MKRRYSLRHLLASECNLTFYYNAQILVVLVIVVDIGNILW